MPVFRRLCPEQLLRPGDDAEIGRITILFTDLVGSTRLYDSLGDATAYNLVRDHFAFLSERVQRHNGFIVKTVGENDRKLLLHSRQILWTIDGVCGKTRILLQHRGVLSRPFAPRACGE
jgi:hypothetical protein